MKRYKLLLILLTICLFFAAPAFGQSSVSRTPATKIEKLLETETVNFAQAAWLVLEAADLSGSFTGSGTEAAFGFASQKGWLPKKAAPQDRAKLEEVSLLIMRSFGIKGGLFYTLFKNPHYAYRELVYRDIIQGKTDPQMPVSGDLLLFMVNRVLSRAEES